MELAPTNLDRAIRRLAAVGRTASTGHGKLYAYQIFRGLGYVHWTAGLCHRDVKPSNLLLYPSTGVLKLCDFGSAKDLSDGRPNARYACSRRYRAPELLFDQPPDAPDYTAAVDVWSAGCVYAELMAGVPLFLGTSVEHQRALVARPPEFPRWAPADAVRLVTATLRFDPDARPTAPEACDHECFDAIRRPGGHRLPPLFDDHYDDYVDDDDDGGYDRV
uniref:Shaggy-related protein kinase iota n=2 Tax=Melanaphis sacchari TaxID=742174 RepID=A0A2H8TY40_9HEMI